MTIQLNYYSLLCFVLGMRKILPRYRAYTPIGMEQR